MGFRKIELLVNALYQISDWADLCQNYAAQQDIADALERIVQVLSQEVTALRADHGDGG